MGLAIWVIFCIVGSLGLMWLNDRIITPVKVYHKLYEKDGELYAFKRK